MQIIMESTCATDADRIADRAVDMVPLQTPFRDWTRKKALLRVETLLPVTGVCVPACIPTCLVREQCVNDNGHVGALCSTLWGAGHFPCQGKSNFTYDRGESITALPVARRKWPLSDSSRRPVPAEISMASENSSA